MVDVDYILFPFLVLIISFGVPGNMLSFMIWNYGKRCRLLPISAYFKVLAVLDIFVLLLPGMEQLLFLRPLQLSKRNINDVFCKVTVFLQSFGLRLSMWTTSTMTVEKVLHLYMPFRFMQLRPTKRVYITLALVGIIAFGLTCHILVMFEITNEFCALGEKYRQNKRNVYFELSNEVLSLYTIPVFLLIICNILILAKMSKISRNTVGNRNDERRAQRQVQLRHTVYHVIAVSTVSCLTMLPNGILYFLSYLLFIEGYASTGIVDLEVFDACFRIFTTVVYLNNAVNFVLYCSVGRAFRQDLRGEFSRCFRFLRTRNERSLATPI